MNQTQKKAMKVFWLVSLFLWANAAFISDIAANEASSGEKHQYTVEEIKELFSGIKSRQNFTLNDYWFHKTRGIRQNEIDIRVEMLHRKEYYGTKIDVDITHNVTKEGKFFIKVKHDYYDKEETYKLNIYGTIKKRPVNETGKMILHWDKVGFIYEADADQISTDFNNISLEFDCINPTVKMEGLNDVVDQIGQQRLNSVVLYMITEYWTRDMKEGKVSTRLINEETCTSATTI